MLKEFFSLGNIYIYLWFIYFFQKEVGIAGIIAQVLIFALIAIGLWHAYEVTKWDDCPYFFKGLNAMMLLYFVYGTLTIIFFNDVVDEFGATVVDKRNFLKNALMSLLPIYSSYYFLKTEMWTNKSIYILIGLLFGYAIFNFFQTAAYTLESRGVEESTNNASYFFVSLMPALFYLKKYKLLQTILMLVCMAFIVLGFKRGAIICGAACFLYFVYRSYAVGSEKDNTTLTILLTIAIFISAAFITRKYAESEFIQGRVEQTKEGSSSGRDRIYGKLWDTWKYDSDLFQQLFGRGGHQTVGIAGNYAHCDWLELLTDCGVLGILFFIYLFYNSVTYIRAGSGLGRDMLAMCLLLLFIKSIFSMGIDSIGIVSGSWYALGVSEIEKAGEEEEMEGEA